MYFVCESIYYDVNPLTEDEFAVVHKAHVANVAKGVEQGIIMLGGPKIGCRGGFLIGSAETKEEVEAFLATDPLVINKVSYFKVTPWNLKDVNVECVKKLF